MLTNERIDRMVGRTNWLLLTFANGTQGIVLDPVAARNFARSIEAEVLQSQESVGGITPFNPLNAASNVLPCRAQNATHAPQDVLQNADATQAQEPVAWFIDDNVCDKSATTYDPKVAQRWKEKGWPVTALYTTPQPLAPCPKCDELHSDLVVKQGMLRIARAERDELQAKVAEIESLRMQDAKAYERLDELRNRDADKIAEQAVLIEKCEKALQTAFEWGSPMLAAPRSARPEWIDRVRSALVAIAAKKGGAK